MEQQVGCCKQQQQQQELVAVWVVVTRFVQYSWSSTWAITSKYNSSSSSWHCAVTVTSTSSSICKAPSYSGSR
jgi:hypothetical protein